MYVALTVGVAGTALMVTEKVAVVAAQPLAAATVLVTIYVPGVLLASVITPVVASSVSPAAAEKVPAVLAAGTTGAGLVADAQ